MARLHSTLALSCAIALPIALPLALGGCAGVLIVGGLGAAAGGGYAVAQERGVNGAVDDVALKTDIEAGLTNQDPQLQAGINTTVFGGRVLLTGRVANPEMKAAAAQIAGRTHDVRALYDEIEVAPPSGAWDDANDAWITTRVRSQMVVDPDVRSVNYTIDTANGSVYLIGSARSQAELDRAAQIARYVPGVRRVVSYVEIRSGAPVAAMPAPPPATNSSANSALRRPSATPQATIQVQKL
jgi:osmotically-inducible protein OsmY